MRILNTRLFSIIEKVINTKSITKDEALFLLSPSIDIWDLLYGAHIIKSYFTDNKVYLCSIINAKSGNCSEDCNFCAQSAFHKTHIKTYSLLNIETIKKVYRECKRNGVDGFSIVTSGKRLSGREILYLSNVIAKLNEENKQQNPYLCVSVGQLTVDDIYQLKKSGLTKCHHNLETSRRFFPQICSTHSYDERITTIQNLKRKGIKVCSGGLFGIGEKWKDRVDLAFTLKELDVDSVPLNFLIPIKGTPLENQEMITPIEALKIIALFRYILTDKNIRICAGREKILRDLQSLIFYAGANGMMIGGYLTQPGRNIKNDFQMLTDLKLKF
jgi:biotin synthase